MNTSHSAEASRLIISTSNYIDDPITKIITMLQAIDSFSYKIINESDSKEYKSEKIAMYAGNILDLVELCIYFSNTPPFLPVKEIAKTNAKHTLSASAMGFDKPTLSSRLQLARENLGLTEADVARELGIYSDHISDWECGITELPAGMVIPLANALKCDPLWLLSGLSGESSATAEES